MKINDLIAKVRADGNLDSLTDEEKENLFSYVEPDVDGAANARAKRERQKFEKKQAESDAQNEELREQLEAAQAGGSEAEKAKRESEKTNALNAKLKADLDTVNATLSAAQRDFALRNLPIQWQDNTPPDYVKSVLTRHFQDVDQDDLANPDVVGPLVEKIRAEQSQFIVAPVKSGAGTNNGKTQQSGQPTEGMTVEKAAELSRKGGKDLIDNFADAFAVAGEQG